MRNKNNRTPFDPPELPFFAIRKEKTTCLQYKYN